MRKWSSRVKILAKEETWDPALGSGLPVSPFSPQTPPGGGGVGMLQAVAGQGHLPCRIHRPPTLSDECDPPPKPHLLPGRGGRGQRLQTMALSAATSEGML